MSDYTPERWAAIKALQPSQPRWVHVSVSFYDEEVPNKDGTTSVVRRRRWHGSYVKGKK